MTPTTQVATAYVVHLRAVEQEMVVGEFPTRDEADDLIASRLGPNYKPADFYVEACLMLRGSQEIH